MFVVFDLDGTLALIDHRVHYVRNGNRNWDAFFAACPDDTPNWPVIGALKAHIDAGHRVEIWSGRSDQVLNETETWLDSVGIDSNLLTRMRVAGDYTPDVALKRSWLHSLHESERPDAIYDDRLRVVEMWREEGIPCFQVAPGDFDDQSGRIVEPITNPLLTVMVGPSGAGKSTWVADNAPHGSVVSSDDLRLQFCGTIEDQSRNDDVFLAMHRIAKARLDSGLPVVIDATNLRQKDRVACASLAPSGATVRYVVIDRPMDDKVRDGGWRNGVVIEKSGLPLMELHAQRFRSQIKSILNGDGLPNVTVLDMRMDAARKAA
jgi:hypothetical protein